MGGLRDCAHEVYAERRSAPTGRALAAHHVTLSRAAWTPVNEGNVTPAHPGRQCCIAKTGMVTGHESSHIPDRWEQRVNDALQYAFEGPET
jgi:hypothetical protein